ncbi:MAG TPA: site-specific DNA-methyltransferase, partial [Sedimentisphaerales bacterium]|nr:site-specific DNA-methyltransferase [Sedimentisphaerales bacterium]
DVQIAAYRIADNQTASIAEWDFDALAAEIEKLKDVEFDLDLLGFGDRELAELLAMNTPEPGPEGGIPEPPKKPVSKTGDLWLMGEHRLLCGDSTKAGDVAGLMGGEKAGVCFTSPPYGQQRDYTEASDCSDWDGLMQGVFGNLPMADDGQVLVNLGLIHRDCEWIPYWDGWIEWMRGQGWRRFGWYVWDQGAGLMGDWSGRLAPSFEFIFHFNRNSIRPTKHVATKESSRKKKKLGAPGQRAKDGTVKRMRMHSLDKTGQATKIPDSVIRISRNATFDMARNEHPATFPIQLPAEIMKAWGGSCYDPFSGSGTTIIACEQLGRKCYAIEIEPRYVDVAVIRWQNYTGRQATLQADGKTFADHALALPPDESL